MRQLADSIDVEVTILASVFVTKESGPVKAIQKATDTQNMDLVRLLLLGLLALAGPSALFAAPPVPVHQSCNVISELNALLLDRLDRPVDAPANDGVRFVRQNPAHPISFGIEIEVSIRENPKLVRIYRPPTYKEGTWRFIPEKRRIQIAAAWEKENFGSSEKVAFIRMRGAPPGYPEKLYFEGDGNFEINGPAFRTHDELKRFVEDFVSHYGPGSFQAHVAYPATGMRGSAGYVIFEADRYQLKAFERNYARHLKDPSVIPAKNLVHHSLGPLGESDRAKLLLSEDRVLAGGKPLELGMTRITSAPVYRGDSYPPGYVGHELRQFHKRYQELLDAADDLSLRLESEEGLAVFERFSRVLLITGDLPKRRASELGIAINSIEWTTFFRGVGEKVRVQFPNLAYGGAAASERFFYPLRDWENYPVVQALKGQERAEVVARIRTATRAYIEDVSKLIESSKLPDGYGGFNVTEATLERLQILAARWGHQVALSHELDKFSVLTKKTRPARAPPTLVALQQTLRGELKTFPNGKKYIAFKMDPSVVKNPDYTRLLEESVEVIYQPKPPFGHISLRVGKRFYGFKYIMDTVQSDFRPTLSMPGTTGFLFEVPKEKILALQDRLEIFYASSAAHNLPAFDAYSPMLKIEHTPHGLQLKSPSFEHGNNLKVDAKIISKNGKLYLRSAEGYEQPIVQRGQDLYVQSYSCSTSCTHVLSEIFDLDIGVDHGAESLMRELSAGSPGGTTPAAIIDYSK